MSIITDNFVTKFDKICGLNRAINAKKEYKKSADVKNIKSTDLYFAFTCFSFRTSCAVCNACRHRSNRNRRRKTACHGPCV